MTSRCATIDKYFNFHKAPLSEEEEKYPLAYGLVVYKTIVQVGIGVCPLRGDQRMRLGRHKNKETCCRC